TGSMLESKVSALIAEVRQAKADSAAHEEAHQAAQTAQDGLREEFEIERGRLKQELLQTAEVAAKLESEKGRLIAEIERIQADSAAEMEKVREEAKAEAAKQPARAENSVPPTALQQELERAEAKLQEILKIID